MFQSLALFFTEQFQKLLAGNKLQVDTFVVGEWKPKGYGSLGNSCESNMSFCGFIFQ